MTTKFELPADITALDADALAALLTAGLTESKDFESLADDASDEQIERAEYVVDGIAAIRAQQGVLAQAAEARAERVAATKNKLAAVAEEPSTEVETEPEAEEPVVDEPIVEVPDDASELVGAEAVTASAKGVASAVASKAAPAKPKALQQFRATASASADIKGFATGAEMLTIDEMTEAMIARFAGFPKGKTGKNVTNRFGVAAIKRGAPEELTLTRGDKYANMAKIQGAAKSYDFDDKGAIVAAGGWCAPSETAYTLTTLGGVSNLLQLPEVTVQHGGISFTRGIDPAAIYTDSGFLQTEAQAEAGTEKNFIDVECPEFEEVRLDAIGFGIRAGILTESGWPELVREYILEVQKAHAYKVNAYKIGKIVTAAGGAINATELGSMLVDSLSQLEMQAVRLRYKYHLPETEMIEGFAPIWAKAVFRQDLAYQEGKDTKAVTDAELTAWLAVRKIRLQWVFGYQDLAATGVTWPATLDIILYPKGTFVVGTTDVISLDAVYDTASLAINTYTAAFFEEGVMVFSPTGNAVKVQLTLASSGVHGRSGADDITNLVAP